MKRRQKENFRMFKALLPLVIFSIIVSSGLGINYVVSAISGIHDGIGIDNFLAYWIIGEGNWSISLFKNYFKYSLMTSIILLIIYSGMRIQKD
jgi:hypothetical protein